MIWVFICSTQGCFHNENPVRLVNPTTSVLCGACFNYSDAIETDEPVTTLGES